MPDATDDKGKLEVSVRILGNELVALRMDVDDFKMKWLVIVFGLQPPPSQISEDLPTFALGD